jgi:hypothetical protein
MLHLALETAHQKEGDPRVTRPALPGALRYSASRAAAELGALPLRQSSPTAPGSPPLLGALRGGGKAHRTKPDAIGGRSPVGSRSALCVVEQRKTQRKKGRGLSEDRRSEFRSPPLRLSSAEYPAQPGDAVGALSSWVLLLGKTRRSTSPAGETQRLNSLPRRTKPARQEQNKASQLKGRLFPNRLQPFVNNQLRRPKHTGAFIGARCRDL